MVVPCFPTTCGPRLIDLLEQRNTSMNIFPCHEQGVWQCEWHDECLSNFTLETPGISIIVRDGQQPNAPNAMEFADPNAKFVAVSLANPSSTAATSDTVVITATPGSLSTTSSHIKSLTTATAAGTSSPPDYVPPSPTPTPATSYTLSAGAKAGIAVGVVSGALAVATLLYFLLIRRRRSMHVNAPGIAGAGGTDHLCGHCGNLKSELSGQPAWIEVDAADVKPELMGQNLRWEMDGGSGLNR